MPPREAAPQTCTFVLVPGLEEKIRHLAMDQFGEDAKSEPLPQLVALLLPDLVDNALAGDMQPSENEGEPTGVFHGSPRDQESELPSDLDPEIRRGIEEAASLLENPNVEVPLQVGEPEAKPAEDVRLPSFEELTSAGRVHPDAVTWAKGHPGKEAAVVETCLGMPPALWGIAKMPSLVERTYNMRVQADATDIH